MAFSDLIQVKKGDYGESLVDDYLKTRGIIPYKPDADKAHPFDRLCASSDKKNLYVVEVKTKAKRKFFPDTGIDISSYNDYKNIQNKYNLDVYMFFIDEEAGEIYGGLLNNISKKHIVTESNRIINYPLIQKKIIYFPIELMAKIKTISKDDINKLKKLTTKKDIYK